MGQMACCDNSDIQKDPEHERNMAALHLGRHMLDNMEVYAQAKIDALESPVCGTKYVVTTKRYSKCSSSPKKTPQSEDEQGQVLQNRDSALANELGLPEDILRVSKEENDSETK